MKLDETSLEQISYGDTFTSGTHGRVVRFVRWVDAHFCEVMTTDTCKTLADYEHREWMTRWAQIRR